MNKQLLLTLTLAFASTGLMAGDAENMQLFNTVAHNDVAGVQAAIEQHADVNARSANGNTPLHMAVLIPDSKTRKEIITLLVSNGARVNLPNNAGQLPADLARTMPDFEDVQELLGVGTCSVCREDIKPSDDFVRGSEPFGCDPRHIFHPVCLTDYAGHQTAMCPICRVTLDEHAAHTERLGLRGFHNIQQETGGAFAQQAAIIAPPAPTISAIDLQLINAAHDGNLAQIQTLLAQEANVNARDSFGDTALTTAVRFGHTQVVHALLTHPSINVNARNIYSVAALIAAAIHGHTEIATALLAHPGIDINTRNYDGETVLMCAAHNGRTQIVTALLAQQAINVNAQTLNSWTALMFAALRGHTATVTALLAYPGIDVNAHNEHGNTAFILAARNDHAATVTALLAHPDIDVNARDIYGYTALMFAAHNGNTEIVRALLTLPGINVNARNARGETALTLAIESRQAHVKSLLMEHGAQQ